MRIRNMAGFVSGVTVEYLVKNCDEFECPPLILVDLNGNNGFSSVTMATARHGRPFVSRAEGE